MDQDRGENKSASHFITQNLSTISLEIKHKNKVWREGIPHFTSFGDKGLSYL